MSARPRRAVAALMLGVLVVAVGPLSGLDRLTLTIADLEGEGWHARGVRVELDLADPRHAGFLMQVDALELPPPLDGFRAASARCAAARIDAERLACRDARLRLERLDAPPVTLAVALDLDPVAGALRVVAREQAFLDGRASLDLKAGPGTLSLDLRLARVALAPLAALAMPAGPQPPVVLGAGVVSASATLRRRPGVLDVDIDLNADGVEFSDASGLRAGERVGLSFTVTGQGPPQRWQGRARAALRAGAVYLHPVLLEVTGEPIAAQFSAERTADVLHIRDLRISDPGIARMEGALELGPGPELRALELALPDTPAAGLYRRYLKAFAGAGVLADLSVSGEVGGSLSWRASGPAASSLRLRDLNVGDSGGRFGLLGLTGDVHWTREQAARESRLGWSAVQVGRLGFGAAQMVAELHDGSARLLAPVETTLLDGALRVERLEASALGDPAQRVEADLSLTPISLARLSERLAWLPLAGSIEGRVPRLTYADGRLSVAGDLELGLFDGRVRVSNLSLEDPFGVVPRLRADLAADDIDLAVLTRALSFGSIEGRLQARVESLVLERWQPVAFDAILQTPPGDTSRHRISQRAVDNLASLGGANAVLSSTFLRVFSEFSYDRLGLSCRLRAGVCEMGGVAPAARGYYLVKGGGLPPRVNVVGFNERVDWPTLVDRLRAVASAEGPVVR